MRKYAILAMAATAAVGFTSVAQAATTSQVTVGVGSTKAGKTKAPKKNSLDVKVTATDPDGKLDVATTAKVYFGKGFQFNGKYLPVCPKADAAAKNFTSKKCKAAIVGTGKAQGYVGNLSIPANVTAFNGGANTIYLFALPTDPGLASLAPVLKGTLKKGTGEFKGGQTLDVDVSETAQRGLAIASFQTKVGGKTVKGGKKRKIGKKKSTVKNFVESTSCPSGGWKFGGAFSYKLDPSNVAATTTVACK
jgi:hypothetical protein